MTYRLDELTHERAEKLIEKTGTIDIITKSGTVYHIIRTRKGYKALSHHCYNPRPLTKAMQKIFF